MSFAHSLQVWFLHPALRRTSQTTMHNSSVAKTWSQAGVSAREAEVLAALAEHLTNAENGARRFISITTEQNFSTLFPYPFVDNPLHLSGRAVLRVQ